MQITNIIDMGMRPRPQWKCEIKKKPNRDTLLDLFDRKLDYSPTIIVTGTG